jgi:hypothetical protein
MVPCSFNVCKFDLKKLCCFDVIVTMMTTNVIEL